VFFFFSSRRRHTRFSRDWSSDVCSSDLRPPLVVTGVRGELGDGDARLLLEHRDDFGDPWLIPVQDHQLAAILVPVDEKAGIPGRCLCQGGRHGTPGSHRAGGSLHERSTIQRYGLGSVRIGHGTVPPAHDTGIRPHQPRCLRVPIGGANAYTRVYVGIILLFRDGHRTAVAAVATTAVTPTSYGRANQLPVAGDVPRPRRASVPVSSSSSPQSEISRLSISRATCRSIRLPRWSRSWTSLSFCSSRGKSCSSTRCSVGSAEATLRAASRE